MATTESDSKAIEISYILVTLFDVVVGKKPGNSNRTKWHRKRRQVVASAIMEKESGTRKEAPYVLNTTEYKNDKI